MTKQEYLERMERFGVTDEFSHLIWLPDKMPEALAALETAVKALPHGKMIWPCVKDVADMIGVVLDRDDDDDPYGIGNDGVLIPWTDEEKRLYDFIIDHDDLYNVVIKFAYDLVDLCNEELAEKHGEDWQNFCEARDEYYEKLIGETHYAK